jgi:protein involved in polysaccharide export with SLBB domain
MKKLTFILFSLLIAMPMHAQNLSNLTPDQLELYKRYRKAQLSESNSSGNSDEIQQVDRTLSTQNLDPETGANVDNYSTQNKKQQPFIVSKQQKEKTDSLNNLDIYFDEASGKFVQIKKEPELEIFGSNLFNKQNLTFEPKLNIPTPPNYVLGTYDELIVDVSGLYEATFRTKISPDGFIRIPTVGMIKVSGQTITETSSIIKNRLSQIYNGVTTGQTRVNVSLGNIRSIRVTVIGEATRPGTYTLPSLATAFNVLYACGGPGKMGSIRDIQVIRYGKTIANIDMYSFLIEGTAKNNVSLQDEDVIKIAPYRNRVTIKGAVKHPAIFEVLKDEKLENLIRYASGFTENANKSLITLFRLEDKKKTVIEVKENELSSFKMESGDVYSVTETYDDFNNKVVITGAVYRPGAYSLEPGLTMKKLIEKADGLKEDAYLNLGSITRKRDNQVSEIISFSPGSLLRNLTPEIQLQNNDTVRISSLYDLHDKDSVSIWGAVKSPGTYKFLENTTLKDILFRAKGFTDAAYTDSVELVRIISDPKTLEKTDKKTEVFKFSLNENLEITNGIQDFLLQNGDLIIVRSIPGYETPRMVQIDGEVLKPGKYNIINKRERISSILKRAGGFAPFAYPQGAYLIRKEEGGEMTSFLKQKIAENLKRQLQSEASKKMDVATLKESGKNVNEIEAELTKSNSVNQIFESVGIVGIDLKRIMQHPGSDQDFFLENGDYLYIPRELQTVRVLGEVLFPTYVGYESSKSLKSYVDGAGGFSDNALRKSVFIVHANGSVKSTKYFFGIKTYPKVTPGSYIVVPPKPMDITKKLTTTESVSIMTSIATVAALIISVLK